MKGVAFGPNLVEHRIPWKIKEVIAARPVRTTGFQSKCINHGLLLLRTVAGNGPPPVYRLIPVSQAKNKADTVAKAPDIW